MAGSATRKRSTGSGAKGAAARKPRTPAKPRTSSARKPAPRARRKTPGIFGKGVRGTWNLLAKGLGTLARTVGRTRELEPEHRRDGLALGLIGLGIVAAVGVWWRAAGPIGTGVEIATRTVLGAGAVTLPLVLVVVAVALMRSEPHPETRPRMVVGTIMVVLSVLGMLHIFTALPATNDGRMYAGGIVGAFSGGLLTMGVTTWVAVPLLILALFFGVLV
ncbi:DNA translocase FtsK 4TM domain-containing protein, partial [Amycolatopsis sp.]|uniref:DNA translocase FtsK 4TM domain-containing protein n=1 Tax=Amycolatopsis sp. TaxID=37632 RepID=UPI002D7E714A